MSDRTCSIDGCPNKLKSRGWCMKHYARWRSHGDPLGKAKPKPFEHGTRQGYDRGKCRCDKCKAANAALAKEYNRKIKERDGVSWNAAYKRRKNGAHPKCVICGDELARSLGADVPMHRDCKNNTPRWKREGRPGPAERKARAVLAKAAEGVVSKRLWVAGSCPWCGEYYVGQGAFCSDGCRRTERRSKDPRSGVIPPDVRLSVYERDGWVCQICFSPTSREYAHDDSFAPTLDHIEPQSAVLIPDHSLENLRTTHLWCNSYRGDGSRGSDKDVAQAFHNFIRG